MRNYKLLLALAVAAVACAAEAPRPAADILAEARAQATAQHKNVLLVFHASWCGWCRRFDQFLNASEIKPIVDRYFVQAHMTVLEREEKRELNNPGSDVAMEKAGGKNAGLPFFAFLKPDGSTIVNTLRPDAGKPEGANIGHPAQPEEVDWFLTMVSRAAPEITARELKTLETWLRNQKK